jgi:hypothetical protein
LASAARWPKVGRFIDPEDRDMPLRTASINRQIDKNGAALHRAMMQRVASRGEQSEPSEQERALAQEREHLKDERARRHDQALQPRPKADKLVRTHHAEPKAQDKPKAHKEPKQSKDAKPGKPKPTRAEKQVVKAAAREAAKQSARRKPKA